MAFMQSAQYANVLDNNNRLVVPDSHDVSTQSMKESITDTEEVQPKISNDECSTTFHVEAHYHKFELLTSTGKKATISLPCNSTKEDIEMIKGVVNVFIPN